MSSWKRFASVPLAALASVTLTATACSMDSRIHNQIDDLPAMNAVLEKRIGSVDDPNFGFSRLLRADVDRDGNVFALQGLDHQIRVYSPDGILLRRIGRRGSGPGEFNNPPRFGLVGDTLWTYDSPSGRLTLFDRTGRVLATGRTQGLRVPARTGYGYVTPVSMRADGLLVGWFTRITYSRDDPPPNTEEHPAVPRVLFDASGAVVNTIGWTPHPPPRMVPPVGSSEGRSRTITIGSESYSVPDPPTSLPQWLPLNDGHIIVNTPNTTNAAIDTFTVTRIDLAGDTLYHSVLSYKPQPYTREMLDSVASQQPRTFMNGADVTKTVDQAVMNRLRSEMRFPEFQLPLDIAWIANDNAVWLRRVGEPGRPARWILLEQDGKPKGLVQLPASARLLWSRGDTLWASVPDELEVPWLTRYRLTR